MRDIEEGVAEWRMWQSGVRGARVYRPDGDGRAECDGENLFPAHAGADGTHPAGCRGSVPTASLNATIDIVGWYAGGTAPLSVSLTLTGTGDVSHGDYHSNERWGNTTVHSRSSGSYRDAIASGDVVWRGEDLMDTSSAGAS